MRPWLLGLAFLLIAAAPASFPEGRLAADLPLQLESGNLCVAPHSLADVLTMVGQGAAGSTRTEFEALLGSLDGPAALARNRKLPLLSANRLWVQSGLPVTPDYASYCQEYFGASPGELDFRHSAEAASSINDWFRKQTEDRIPHLVDDLDQETRLVLTNATTLKALWAVPFDPALTRPEPFLTADGSNPKVPMMTCKGEFLFYEEGGVKVVEMPYKEADLSLVVVMPAPGQLAALEKKLKCTTLSGWLDKLSTDLGTNLQLSFPKMEIRSNQLELKKPLMALGLEKAFGRESDFSGISSVGDNLYIDEVVQSTLIRFDEAGTEAAAATAASVVLRDQPPELRIDHPFLFFLVHRPTASVLFSGRVVKP